MLSCAESFARSQLPSSSAAVSITQYVSKPDTEVFSANGIKQSGGVMPPLRRQRSRASAPVHRPSSSLTNG